MRRSQITVFIHLVWATWDRLPLLTPDVQRQAYRVIGAKCDELGAQVIALGGIEDHVHLLVGLPATISIAELVKHIKGASGHLLAQQGAPHERFFKWQGAYGAFSVSPSALPDVTHYITHQREHHNRGTLIAEWELSADEEKPGERGGASA